jgi:hypothetical protein
LEPSFDRILGSQLQEEKDKVKVFKLEVSPNKLHSRKFRQTKSIQIAFDQGKKNEIQHHS